jgi:hypothetical protein
MHRFKSIATAAGGRLAVWLAHQAMALLIYLKDGDSTAISFLGSAKLGWRIQLHCFLARV